MSDICWNMLLVPSGIEHIRIKRDHKIIFEGAVPEGFSQHLFVGDAVYTKWAGRHWIKKFDLCIWKDHPSIHFGRRFGNPHSYIWLHTLPHVPGVTYRGKLRQRFLDWRATLNTKRKQRTESDTPVASH